MSFKVKLTESQRELILKAAFNEDDGQIDLYTAKLGAPLLWRRFHIIHFNYLTKRLRNMANRLAEKETWEVGVTQLANGTSAHEY